MINSYLKTADMLGGAVGVLECFPFLEICVSARLCSKGGKAQIIGPEEEDEEDDGYAFNEVRRTCSCIFIFSSFSCTSSCCSLHLFKYSYFSSLSPSLSKMDGPFQDLELLKSRPAHMAVFMRYVFTQLLDPNPLVSLHDVL